MFKQYFSLLRFEWLSERRKRHILPTLLLYISCVFFLLFQWGGTRSFSLEALLGIYWVIQLFLSVWISFESLQSETIERMRFWLHYIPLQYFFLFKCVYNIGINFCLTNLVWWCCHYFLIEDSLPILLHFLFSLASTCFVLVFSFVSYVVFLLQKQMGLALVLGIPLLLPLLLITVKLVKQIIAAQQLGTAISLYSFFPSYILMTILILACGVFLLPFLRPE